MTSKALAPIEATIRSERFQTQLKTALPATVSHERFTRVVVSALHANPDLAKADRGSLYLSCLQAAQLGLMTDSQLGEAYLVPYKGKVQMIPGYRGLLKLARQAGHIKSIDVDVIREGDEVIYKKGDESEFSIVSDWDNEDAEAVGYYAIAHFKDGGLQRAVMSKGAVEKIRKASSGANSPAWKNHYDEMAKKTVFRRLCKMLNLSTEAAVATKAADREEDPTIDITPDLDPVDVSEFEEKPKRNTRKKTTEEVVEEIPEAEVVDEEPPLEVYEEEMDESLI